MSDAQAMLPPLDARYSAAPSHLAMAIMAVVVFWPLGLPAIINAAKVDRMVFTGDYAGALHTSGRAKYWSMWAFGVAIGVFVLYLVAMALMVAGLALSVSSPAPFSQ